ncbi:hypothetical protein MSG28_006409 [Choristoneura fumiferana]|uniref:Uncharacterized protein n=1 Tax=Choristoneura fumiferana TaxID=7141 RepID=A0ACC0JEU7_CHOFU|nr:hypothetical protein MSG28_006409 [Choristoneura fumiferana]
MHNSFFTIKTRGAKGEISVNGVCACASQSGGRGGAKYIRQHDDLRAYLTIYEAMALAAALSWPTFHQQERKEKSGGRGGAKYIRQHDDLRAYLTIYEAMALAAALKLADFSPQERKEKVSTDIQSELKYKSFLGDSKHQQSHKKMMYRQSGLLRQTGILLYRNYLITTRNYMISCVSYVVLSYWLTDNPLEPTRATLFLATIVATSLCAQAWGYFIEYCHYRTPTKFLKEMDMSYIDVGGNMTLILCTTVLMHMLTCVALWYRLNKR